jgi:hypothetical protein
MLWPGPGGVPAAAPAAQHLSWETRDLLGPARLGVGTIRAVDQWLVNWYEQEDLPYTRLWTQY